MGEPPFFITFSGAFEQRIALELSFHVDGKVQIGELQQLDGLHQLRRHHKRMALPNLESLSKRHGLLWYGFPAHHNQLQACSLVWSDSCLSAFWPGVYQDHGAVVKGAAGGARTIAGTTARRGILRQGRGGGLRDRSQYRPCAPPSAPAPNK